MGKKAISGTGWAATAALDGVRTITCESWSGFSNLVTQPLLDFESYIYRGQSSSDWKLSSVLDRSLEKIGSSKDKKIREKHLAAFQRACLGRRGPNPVELEPDDWWALGQHHGLYTPLLDWTESPFVAAYFSYALDPDLQVKERAVWALNAYSVEQKLSQVDGDMLSIVRPLMDENARLISQRGLFTRAPDGVTIEEWVSKYFKGYDGGGVLMKILLPNSEQRVALRSLNRMNINHLSLFPDMEGSAKYVNFSLTIDKY